MHLPEDAVLLRIFIGESDRYQHRPLYEAIVLKARELQMAGATVLRGPMGFGKSSHLHTAKILRLSMDLPIVIEIVDSDEKVNAFLPVLDEMMGGGLITIERAKVIRYQGQGNGYSTPNLFGISRLLELRRMTLTVVGDRIPIAAGLSVESPHILSRQCGAL